MDRLAARIGDMTVELDRMRAEVAEFRQEVTGFGNQLGRVREQAESMSELLVAIAGRLGVSVPSR